MSPNCRSCFNYMFRGISRPWECSCLSCVVGLGELQKSSREETGIAEELPLLRFLEQNLIFDMRHNMGASMRLAEK